MIIETIDIHGHEQIINMAFIANIEITTIGRPNGHPCCGEKGDTLIRINMSTGQTIKVACDHDGDDVTAGVLGCWKSWGYRATMAQA